jgi:hypothetical protein
LRRISPMTAALDRSGTPSGEQVNLPVLDQLRPRRGGLPTGRWGAKRNETDLNLVALIIIDSADRVSGFSGHYASIAVPIFARQPSSRSRASHAASTNMRCSVVVVASLGPWPELSELSHIDAREFTVVIAS